VSPVFVTARLVCCRVGFLCSPVDFRRAFLIPLSDLGLQRAARISSPDLFVGIARALNGRRFSFPSQSALWSSSPDFGFGCGSVSPFPAQLTRGGFSFSCSAPVDLGASRTHVPLFHLLQQVARPGARMFFDLVV
jgi:hypothetical protein